MNGRPIADIRIWSVQDRRSNPRYARPWIVRWSINRKTFQRGHRTRAEADHYRSLLLVAQRNGEGFDVATGEPMSWSASAAETGVHQWCRSWLVENWGEWQPRTRASAVEALSRLVPLCARAGAPKNADLRPYLVRSLPPGSERDDQTEAWLDRWCLTLADLDRQTLAPVDHGLGLGVDGTPLGPATAGRFRKVARSCIRRAVDLEIIDADPWPPQPRGARQRKVRRKQSAVDTRALPDPATMGHALDAMANHQPSSRRYQAMTATLYYAGLRPSEVVMLCARSLTLPPAGWGAIDVTRADIGFDEPGEPKTGPRTVPIPPVLVTILQTWVTDHALADDDLLFRTRNGLRPSASNWSRAWHRALAKIGHHPLRLYDCRHAAATTWLAAGVPLGEVARRLGHSVEVLVSTYVGALRSDEQIANRLIDEALAEPA